MSFEGLLRWRGPILMGTLLFGKVFLLVYFFVHWGGSEDSLVAMLWNTSPKVAAVVTPHEPPAAVSAVSRVDGYRGDKLTSR